MAVLARFAPFACGGSSAVGPSTASPAEGASTRQAKGSDTSVVETKPNAGSSDGVSCEQAREQYVEEIDMLGGAPADLTANDFGAKLNQGTYLQPCNVPASSKILICAAIKDGSAVGVTVAIDPASPDVELCVAKQVRGLAFPSHPKMDFVTVRF